MNKNKRNMLIAISVSIVILIIGGVRINQIERNYQANKPILEACIDNGGTVVIRQKHFWSLTSATCDGYEQ
ncbi:hypothetical protein ACIQZI_00770 [Peribacillus sp. NPDC096379]|uniref:hypothetical protein n=1 Tax=Peribacillus sp. NPDC096379 TaxID=3364393 RepID=UPI00381080CF